MNYNFLSGTTNLLVKDRCSLETHKISLVYLQNKQQIPLPGWAQSIKQQTDATVFERDVFRCKFFLYRVSSCGLPLPDKAYWEAGYEAYSMISRARLSC
ncbi:unnamed protein product [Musa hybrid cultivar]